MAPSFVRNPEEDLNVYKDGLIFDILRRLKETYLKKELPLEFQLIGIAQNVLLGVFALIPKEYGYACKRIVIDKDGGLLISSMEYPVTNIGQGVAPIECNIDYIMALRILPNII